MEYDICFDAASFLFLLIAFLTTFGRYSKPTKRNFCFKRLLMTLLITLPLDASGGFFITNSHLLPVKLNTLYQSVGFMGISAVVWSYALYMECFITDADKYKKLHTLNICVALLYTAAHIANIFFGFIFYFDGDLIYRRGSLYLIVYFIPFYYFLYGVYIMLANRGSVEKKQFYATMSLVPFILVGCLLQFFVFTQSLVLLFAITLSVVVLFFCVETPDYNKLENALEEADSASRSKSDFLANMSHEIRTPMNAIVGMCELILRERDISDTVQEYCVNIQNSGRNLLSIINDILDFSKIESGKLEIIEEEFSIASVLNDVINMAVARKGNKKLEIVVHADPDIPAVLIGDEVRIRQVIINLVTNAVKYSSEGCIYIRVSQTRHDYGINLSVSVSDTGIGITEENLEKLFSSFQQVDTKKNRAVEGTGLGLAISKQLVERMGGFINVTSKYGKGSEFRFVLPLGVSSDKPFVSVKDAEKIHAAGFIDFNKFDSPVSAREYRTLISELGMGLHTEIELFDSMDEFKSAISGNKKYTHIFTGREEYQSDPAFFIKAAADAVMILIQDREGAIEAPAGIKCLYKPFYVLSAASVFNNESIVTNMNERRISAARFTAPSAKVLVVDDNAVNLKVAEGLMRPYHMQVVTAESAEAAISLLRSKDFHLVFMDHMMPGTDGVEATGMIREMDGSYYKKLPIVALTANALSGVRELFINAGMNDFIAKPIELSALDRVLRTWLPRELIKAPADNEAADKQAGAAPAEKGNDMFSPETGLFYTGGDTQAYLEILEMYAGKSGGKISLIQKLFDEKSWKNYVIEVHALKSSSLSVGSRRLSEAAKELEMAGKSCNYGLIEEKNAALLEMYAQVAERCREHLERNSPEEKKENTPREMTEISLEGAEELIERLCAALDSFDSDGAEDICAEAAGYSCKGTSLEVLLEGARELARDFEYEAAAEKAAEAVRKLRDM